MTAEKDLFACRLTQHSLTRYPVTVSYTILSYMYIGIHFWGK